METLDCRGQQCPQPVIQTRRRMLDQPGEAFRVLVDDAATRDNISRLAAGMGYAVNLGAAEGSIAIGLTPGAKGVARAEGKAASGPTILFITSDQMGSGDPKLGQILLKNYIFTLTECDTTPDAIYFVNSGVRLTVGGSDMIEALKQLADTGVDIASCGLCLEYYGVKDSLSVGRISNMLELVNALGGAGRIIRL